MTVVRRNMVSLENRYPALQKKIASEYAPDRSFEIVSAKSGEPTARINGQFVHSGYNPLREAEKAIASYVRPAVHTYIVYGFGLGYYIEALQRQVADRVDIYVVIDNGHYFYSALHGRSLHHIFGRHHTHYLLQIDGATLVQLIQHLDESAFSIVNIRSISATNRAYFAALDSDVAKLSLRRQGNINTARRFGLLWIANCLHNMATILRSIDCFGTRNMASAIPALLIAAGPSLDSAIDDLKRWAKKMYIIAVDTACNALAAGGVTPDVIIATDPQYWNSRHIDTRRHDSSILLFDPCVHPRVLRSGYRQTIAFSTAVPMVRLLQDYIPLQPSIGAGGTVTSVGWEFGRWIGASEIYLIGVDFGYPQTKIHCRHCFFETRMSAMGTLLDSYESQYHRYLCVSPLEQSTSYSGQPLVSDKRLSIYARWFEEHIEQYRTPQTITLSGEGRALAGVGSATRETIERLPDRQSEKEECAQSLRRMATIGERADRQAAQRLMDNITRLVAAAGDILKRTIDSDDAAREQAMRDAITDTSLAPIEREVLRSMVDRHNDSTQHATIDRSLKRIAHIAARGLDK